MSLFDSVHQELNPRLFTENQQLRSFVREYILQDLVSFMPEGSIAHIFILGSIVGYQYSKDSDIDINVILSPEFQKKVLWPTVKKMNGRALPGTSHPINYFLQNYNPGNFQDAKFGVYNVLKDKWGAQPQIPENFRNPDVKYNQELRYAKFYSLILEDLVQDMIELQHPKLIQKKKEEIQAVLETIEDQRKMVYRFGWGTPRETQQNILYKFIEHLPRLQGLSYDPEDKPIKWKQIINQFLQDGR